MLNKLSRFERRRLSSDLIASLVLVGIGILFFSDFLFSSKNFYFRDILNFHYPLRRVLIDTYSRGEFPLWNPFIYLGQPMLANPNYMAFYPTNLFHLILPFNYAFKLHFIIHPILGGLGAYFLLRRLGIGCMAALTGSIAYEFSGTVLSFLNLYNIVPSVALLPWIGWAFYGALQERWLRRSLLLGGLLALQAIAFEPLMFQCVLLMLAGLAILYVTNAENRLKSAWAAIRIGLVGAGFGLGLAAVQVLPTLELLPLSARGKINFAEGSIWSMHPLDCLNALMPNLFGSYYTIGLPTSWGGSIHQGREGYLVSFFLGGSTILLAVLSWASHRRKLQHVSFGLAFVSIFLALGKYNPLYQWLYEHVPFLSLGRYPSKYFLLSTLAICMMAALGSEALIEKRETAFKKRYGIAIFGLILAGIFLTSWLYFGRHPLVLENWLRREIGPELSTTKNFPILTALVRHAMLSPGIFLSLGSALVLTAPLLKASILLRGLLPVLIAAELIPANLRLSPLMSDADINFVPDVNKYITQQGPEEPYRVVAPNQLNSRLPDLRLRTPNRSSAWLTLYYKMSGQPFYGIMNGIEYSLYYSVDHLNTLEADVLCSVSTKMSEAQSLTLLEKLNSPLILSMNEMKDHRLRLLTMFDTRSDYPVLVYWLNNTSKRAYFASGFDFADSQEEALKRFLNPNFPVGTMVILEGQGKQKAGEMEAGAAKIVKYSNSRVVCEVNSKVQGYLVLLDSYYPGWIARVDGKKTNVLRANYAFRAVQVSAGKHLVEFSYQPVLFYIGLAITSLFLLGGLILVFRETYEPGIENQPLTNADRR